MTDGGHRAEAIACFNRCWELLETADRSSDDDAELLTAAFSSRYHWSTIGGAEQHIVADWMVSRAAAAVGIGHLSLLFAERAYGAGLTEGTPDWLQASTAEGVARAYDASGDQVERDAWCAIASRLVDSIEDAGDRAIIADQLADLLHA